jgi:photosystem II stability/assembly factor-like uncharacterized protein
VEEDFQSAGLTCSADDPCPVYLELAEAESTGVRIFATGNIHSSAVTLYSELLASDDEGRTWREAQDRIRGAALDHIQFLGPENGWIGGESLYPLSRDPFLLITSDGGKTWRRHPMFEEGEPGSLLDFRFSTKLDGVMIFDRGRASADARYARYQSHDGGLSWTVKDTSASPAPLGPPSSEPNWRVRADNGTGAFQVEKRAGDRWTRVASFAVNLGKCKPLEKPAPAEVK